MNKPVHSVSVAAVVRNSDGSVLVMQRRDNRSWEIPGGVLELQESIPDGLRREVLEETGVVVEPQQLTGVYKNVRLGVVALVFRATIVRGSPAPTDEAEAVEWWTPETVQARMGETYAIRVLDALNGHDPAIRMHDGTHILD